MQYVFESSLPAFYKFIQGFIYLQDENKNYEVEQNIQFIITNLLMIFKRLNLLD